jgi:hypothetical protein
MAPPYPALPCPHRARAPHRRFALREYGAVPCLVHDITRSMVQLIGSCLAVTARELANCHSELVQLAVDCGTFRPEPCRTSRA